MTHREQLITRLRELPAEKLPCIEQFLTLLERMDQPSAVPLVKSGDESPHSKLQSKNESGDESPHSKDWPHAPLHRLSDHGTYIVTAGTLHKEHLFRRPECLDLLESAILRCAKRFGWQLEAWAVFSNHYHFVAHAEADAQDLRQCSSNCTARRHAN